MPWATALYTQGGVYDCKKEQTWASAPEILNDTLVITTAINLEHVSLDFWLW